MSVPLPDTLSIPAATPSGPPGFFGLSRAELADRLAERGVPRYRADQIYAWIYQKRHRTTERMSNLPAALRAALPDAFDLALPSILEQRATLDGQTVKFVLGLADGKRVECVSM